MKLITLNNTIDNHKNSGVYLYVYTVEKPVLKFEVHV